MTDTDKRKVVSRKQVLLWLLNVTVEENLGCGRWDGCRERFGEKCLDCCVLSSMFLALARLDTTVFHPICSRLF